LLVALAISAVASEYPRQSFLKLPADAYVILGAVLLLALSWQASIFVIIYYIYRQWGFWV
jgi:hypothetical protein